MSNPRARKVRHAAPSTRSFPGVGMLNGTAGRRLAATAAALTVGAVPLACAGPAAAATPAQTDLSTLGLPNLALPFGLPDSIDPLTAGVPIAQNVLHEGALGTLASGFAPQTDALTGGVIGQAAPLVAQLRQTGVPTVGDLTGKLSETQLPMVGSVGSLTQALPVTSMLGADGPVTGALQNVGGV